MSCNRTSAEAFEAPPPNGSSHGSHAWEAAAALRGCLAGLLVLMSAAGFLGNAVVCVIVYQRPAMRSAINLLLATLAFSDIVLSLGCMPFAAATLVTVRGRVGAALCRLWAALHWLCVLQGVGALLVISVDRCLLIAQRRDRLTPRRAKAVIAASWALSLCAAAPALAGGAAGVPARAPQCVLGDTERPAGRAYAATLVVAAFFAPVGIMLAAYLGILRAVRRNAVRVRNRSDALDLRQLAGAGLPRRRRQQPVSLDLSFKTKAFTTILILFVGFSLCWLPHAVHSLLSVFSRRFYCSPSFDTTSSCVLWLGYIKSVFNPVVYCWRIKKFREACLELLPQTFQILPRVPERVRRRVQPSTIYTCHEHQNQSAV